MPDIIYTTPRCQFDEFNHQILLDCINYAPKDCQVYYVWAEPLSNLKHLMSNLKHSSNNVLLFIPDNLTNGNFQPNDQTTWGVQIILDHVKKYPNKKFILITDVHNIEQEYDNVDNLSIVETELITMDKPLYEKIKPVVDKNIINDKHFIALANRATNSRITLLSYLLGQGLEKHGILKTKELIKERIQGPQTFLDCIPWHINNSTMGETLEKGYQKLKKYQEPTKLIDGPYSSVIKGGNPTNFNQYLRNFYSHSLVELCAETYFEESSYMFTEKTLNMILGCNFPILLCGQNSVAHLESMGFDVFRDIVDHSYDNIQDPMARLTSAVDLNIKLLTDKQWATSQWARSIDRFEKNVKHSKQGMYDLIRNRAVEQFKKILL